MNHVDSVLFSQYKINFRALDLRTNSSILYHLNLSSLSFIIVDIKIADLALRCAVMSPQHFAGEGLPKIPERIGEEVAGSTLVGASRIGGDGEGEREMQDGGEGSATGQRGCAGGIRHRGEGGSQGC